MNLTLYVHPVNCKYNEREIMNKLETKIAQHNSETLLTLLKEIDVQVASLREEAKVTGNYETLQAINTVRIAIINQMDQIDETIFTNYCASKYN